MFKNAGTTFDWSLKRCLGRNFIEHRDSDKMIKGGADYLKGILHEFSEIKALSSHHIQLPLPLCNDVKLFPVVLVRHPIDRVGSVYSFERSQLQNTPSSMNARRMTFNEYVEWCMEPASTAVIRNFQTLYLMGRSASPNKLIGDDDFGALVESLADHPLLGIVDQYDESMVLIEKELRKTYPQIDLSYVRRNVTTGRKEDLDGRIHDVYGKLGGGLSELLIENNYWDIKLYNEAKKIINNRISQTERFHEQLCVFQKRCQELEKYKWILNSEMLCAFLSFLNGFAKKLKFRVT